MSQTLLLFSQFNNLEGNIVDSLCYLSITEKIVTSFADNTHDNRTLNIFQNILIAIGNVLIADRDYLQAIKINNQTLSLCFRELFLLIDISEGLDGNLNNIKLKQIGKTQKEAFHCFEKLISNIVTVMYHQGVCLESVGLLKEAKYYYFQAGFFSKKYLGSKYSEFSEFILVVQSKLNKIIDLIDRLKYLDSEKHLSKMSSMKTNYNHALKHENKSLKLITNKVEQYIRALKPEAVKELDLAFKSNSNQSNKLLHQNKLLNKLLSDEFKGIVLFNMKNINTTLFEKSTFDVIQKKITELRNEEFVKNVNSSKDQLFITSNSKSANENTAQPKEQTEIKVVEDDKGFTSSKGVLTLNTQNEEKQSVNNVTIVTLSKDDVKSQKNLNEYRDKKFVKRTNKKENTKKYLNKLEVAIKTQKEKERKKIEKELAKKESLALKRLNEFKRRSAETFEKTLSPNKFRRVSVDKNHHENGKKLRQNKLNEISSTIKETASSAYELKANKLKRNNTVGHKFSLNSSFFDKDSELVSLDNYVKMKKSSLNKMNLDKVDEESYRANNTIEKDNQLVNIKSQNLDSSTGRANVESKENESNFVSNSNSKSYSESITELKKIHKRPNSVLFKGKLNSAGEKEVEKYDHSRFILTKGYRKKFSLLESTADKDNYFHIQLLHLKKDQKIPLKIATQEAVYKEAQEYFDTALRCRKIIPNQHNFKPSEYDIKKIKYQRKAIMNMDYSIYQKFMKEDHSQDNYYTKMINRFKSKTQAVYGKDKTTSDSVNKKISDVVVNELDHLDKFIKQEENILLGDKIKKRSASLASITYRSSSVGKSFISFPKKNKHKKDSTIL